MVPWPCTVFSAIPRLKSLRISMYGVRRALLHQQAAYRIAAAIRRPGIGRRFFSRTS
jgi:hypothetical protein